MNTMKKFKVPFNKFALRGVSGLVILAAALVAVFWLGGALTGKNAGPAMTDNHPHSGPETVLPSASWTCSMHPQIQLPGPGKCPICFMDLIPVESNSGGGLDPHQLQLSETAVQLARIQTSPVRRGQADRDVRMVGKIAYDEGRLAEITAWVSGRIEKLHADYTGATVRQGESLVRIYSPELLAAQEELTQALAAERELAGTRSRLLRGTAQATAQAAREKLRLLGLSDGQIGSLERSGQSSETVTINSPISGVVIEKPVREGMYVARGDRLVTVADMTRLWATFEAFESDLPWLEPGQRVEFTVPSMSGRAFEAIVSFIDPFVDPVRRTVKVRTVVDNSAGLLKPDMLVQGSVKSRLDGDGDPIRHDQAPLLIPAQAPLLTGKRAVVYVDVTSDGAPVYEGREVELGPRTGDYYVVNTGLNEGDRVVTHGAFKIDSELQIQARPSMMAPAGAIMTAGHQHGTMSAGHPADKNEPVKIEPGLSQEVRQALMPVYDRYFEVQMALAGDDLKAAVAAGRKLLEQVEQVDDSRFSKKVKTSWPDLRKRLAGQAGDLSKAKDLASARDSFYHLSKTVIEMHGSFGHAAQQNYYLTFCPMARDNQGAYWLQTEAVVWNSFWGDMMLRCGSINDTLPPVPSE